MEREHQDQQPSDTVRVDDEDGVRDIIATAVPGLRDVVNNLTRLRPSRRSRGGLDR